MITFRMLLVLVLVASVVPSRAGEVATKDEVRRMVFGCPNKYFAETLSIVLDDFFRADTAEQLERRVPLFPTYVEHNLCGVAGVEDIPTSMWDVPADVTHESWFKGKLVFEIRTQAHGKKYLVALTYSASAAYAAAHARGRAIALEKSTREH